LVFNLGIEGELFIFSGINAQKVNIEKSKVEWIGEKIGGQHNGEIQLKSGEIQFIATTKI